MQAQIKPGSADQLSQTTPESVPTKAGIPTQQLFQGHQEIVIDHKGESYRLRITKNDKLILTK